MKPTIYMQPASGPILNQWLRYLAIIIFIFCLKNAFAQIKYPPTQINAQVVDTAKVAMCQLPFNISNKVPLTGEKVNWKVIKGTATLIYDSTSNLQVKDMKPDTCILTYTTFNQNKTVKDRDTLVLIKTNAGCGVIDRTGIFPGPITCGTSFRLYSKLLPGYTYFWTSSSPSVQIMNPFMDYADVTPNAAGSYLITVTATSPSGYNVLYDSYSFIVNCNSLPIEAGPNVSLNPCDFPYTLSGSVPTAGQTVRWDVMSGSAFLSNATSPNAKITDATSGTVLRYTLTQGAQSVTDMLTVTVKTVDAASCNPVVSTNSPKCNDSFTITFPFTTSNGYTFQWTLPTGITAVGTPTNTATLKAAQAGNFVIKIKAVSPNNLNNFEKTVTINATCDDVTLPNVPDQFINFCEFPKMIFGTVPKAGETVLWEVVTGEAVLQNANTANVSVIDARPNTVLKYTISKGTNSKSDLVNFTINTFQPIMCNPTISKPSPKCGDTVRISFNWPVSIFPNSYTFIYSYGSGVTPNGSLFPNSYTAEFIVLAGGANTINVDITSPRNFNVYRQSIVLNATCPLPTVTKANAGPDATAYCNRFQLAGNKAATGETGTWKVISGSATIAEKNNPNSFISNYTSNKVVLEWKISNNNNPTVFSSDTVEIQINSLKVLISNVVDATCSKNNGSALAQANGGLPPYTFQWQGSTPGNELKNVPAGKYTISVKDQSGCQVVDTATIKNSCIGQEKYIVQGNVYAGNSFLPYGLAILMQNIGGIPIPVQTTNVVNGFYRFDDVDKGDYLVYILPYKEKEHTHLHDQYLPTYYVNKVSAFFANPIHVIEDTYSVDIHLVEKLRTNIGISNLTIHVNLNACIATPLLPVLLFNERDELVGSGCYNGSTVTYSNLASGIYYFSMAIDGLGYKNSQKFEVTDGNCETKAQLIGGKLTGTLSAKFGTVQVFPNPFKDLVMLDLTNLTGDISVKIIEGMTGRLLKEVQGVATGKTIVHTEDLSSGLYILQITDGVEGKSFPLIKN